MTAAYWNQWGSIELDSMHGIEPVDKRDEEIEPEECEGNLEGSCPRCMGNGCNYCLMLEY